MKFGNHLDLGCHVRYMFVIFFVFELTVSNCKHTKNKTYCLVKPLKKVCLSYKIYKKKFPENF